MINSVTTYFTRKELECKHCGECEIDYYSLGLLDRLRRCDGKPMILTSAYRCPEHNKAVGGVKNSQHILGKAFDIRLDGRDAEKLAETARYFGFRGIGIYDTFLHIDTRDRKATWRGKG